MVYGLRIRYYKNLYHNRPRYRPQSPGPCTRHCINITNEYRLPKMCEKSSAKIENDDLPPFFSHKSFLTLILSGTYKPTITTQITVATLPSIPFSVLAVALLGMSSFALSKTGSEYLSPTLAKLPRLSGRASPLSQEKILPLNPDIIIDCVSADDTYKFT